PVFGARSDRSVHFRLVRPRLGDAKNHGNVRKSEESSELDWIFLALLENRVHRTQQFLLGWARDLAASFDATQQHRSHSSPTARLRWFFGTLSRLVSRALAPGQSQFAIFGAQRLQLLGGSDDSSRVNLVCSQKLGKFARHGLLELTLVMKRGVDRNQAIARRPHKRDPLAFRPRSSK